jgi:carbon starvation protein
MTASWQKVFSDDPAVGFFAQRSRYEEALRAGRLLAPARSTADMEAIVRNSTVTGVLSILFAALTIVIVLACAHVSLKAIRSGGRLPLSEAPWVQSSLDASHIAAEPKAQGRPVLSGTGEASS